MTYSSRNFLISGGDGRELRTPRFSNRLSSAMMSLQTSTHSSQMNTVGPAISLRTSFWSLLQNEQRRTSVSPVFFVVIASLFYRSAGELPLAAARSGAAAKNIIDNTVFLRLTCAHDVVAVGIFLDTR